MDFKDRLQQIELAESRAAAPEPPVDDGEEPPAPSPVEHGMQVRCAECGHNTLREEHNAIMCTICCHGPFCNYCWEMHVREFHPQLAESYSDARRGIRPRARIRNHYLIRTVLKPAGYVLALIALFAAVYFGFKDRGSAPVLVPAAATSQAEPLSTRHADAAVPLSAAVQTPSEAPQTAAPDPAAHTAEHSARGEPAISTVTPPSGHAKTPRDDARAPRDDAKTPGAAPISPAETPANKAPLAIEIVQLTSPIQRRSSASLQIRTAPAAFCTIEVIYSSGPSHSKSLGPQVANAAGEAGWNWNIGIRTTPGAWPIEVHCTLKDQQSTATATITIAE